jgi:uncharacterized membrane-anchored protein
MTLTTTLLPALMLFAAFRQEPAAPSEPAQEQVLTYADWSKAVQEHTRATAGPTTGTFRDLAEIQVPEGLWFADADGAKALLEMTGNLTDDSIAGAVISLREEADWFVIFQWDESGYVEDDEKDELDADALMESMKESNKAGNEARRERGLPQVFLVGWEKEPFYDPRTNNLTWGRRLRGETGGESINWDVRLLGRRGVMSVGLVADPKDLQATLPVFDRLVEGYSFNDGHKYAQFVPGDKVAQYGLGALVLGGAGVAASKLGFFSKFWKFIVFGALAVGAFVKGLWNKLFRRSQEAPER